MKIAVATGEFPALSETFVLNQVTGLIDRGHDVHVFANARRKDAMEHPEVQRYELERRATYWGGGRRSLTRLLGRPKRLMRATIDHLLNGSPLRARELLRR